MAVSAVNQLRGVIHGKTIELERDPGLADGQAITVNLHPEPIPGEGIRRSAGVWGRQAKEFEKFLEEMRRAWDRREEPTP